jgi:hypothetical protein
MFNFWPDDATSSSTKNYLVTPYFWIYWAVTIPLTLAVIATGKYWMAVQHRKSGQERESLNIERMVAGQNWHIGGVSAISPMYPSKVIVPSHLHDRLSDTNDVLLF